MQAVVERYRLGAAVRQGWARLVRRTAELCPAALRGGEPAPLPARSATPGASIDPVALTILAVNRLGPATFRTVSLGKAVTVSVPDPETGAIFRAALAEMRKARTTDRLIEIIVREDVAA